MEEMNWEEKLKQDLKASDEALEALENEGSADDGAEGGQPQEASAGQGSSGETGEGNLLDSLSAGANEPSGQEPVGQSGVAQSEPGGLEARVRELEAQLQRERSENGRARVLADKLKAAEEEREALRSRVAELEGQRRPFNGPLGNFSEEESAMMSPELRESLSARFAEVERTQKVLADKVAAADAILARSNREAMNRLVASRFPDLQRTLTSNAWKSYCGEFDPVSRQRVGSLFLDAVNRNDADAVIALIDRFVRSSGISSGGASVGSYRPEEQGFQPQGGAVGGQAPVFRYDEVNRFFTELSAGRLSLSDKSVAERYKAYKAAMDEDRVVM